MNRMARAVCLICSEGEQSRGNLIIPSSVKSTFTRLRSDHPRLPDVSRGALMGCLDQLWVHAVEVRLLCWRSSEEAALQL